MVDQDHPEYEESMEIHGEPFDPSDVKADEIPERIKYFAEWFNLRRLILWPAICVRTQMSPARGSTLLSLAVSMRVSAIAMALPPPLEPANIQFFRLIVSASGSGNAVQRRPGLTLLNGQYPRPHGHRSGFADGAADDPYIC